MRDPNEDGFLDFPQVTVWDAYDHYEKIMDTRELPLKTDQLRHAWKGEWSHFNNGPTSTFGTYATEDRHYVWVPNGTYEMQIAFSSLDWDSNTAQVAQIRPNVDLGSDGDDDAQGQGTLVGDTIHIVLEVEPEHWGEWAEFDVTGNAVSLPVTGILSGSEFMEPRVPYTFDVLLTLDVSKQQTVEVPLRYDGYSDLDPAQPSDLYDPDSSFDLLMVRPVYDESMIPAYEEKSAISAKARSAIIPVAAFGATIFLLASFVGLFLWMKELGRYEDEALESELQDQ
tara:strand:+ start:70 stop:918 length:849 start_codon:yes stop_codon:yes gene_type:complete